MTKEILRYNGTGPRTHLIIPDGHAHPDFDNSRFDYLGRLIADVKPDVVINIGDGADLSSLSTYDKGKRSFAGRSYKKDIDSFLDSQERTWAPIRKLKRKLPFSIYLEGNHEFRIERTLDLSPELAGTVSFNDLDLRRNYDEVVRYNAGTPGICVIDGVAYAHYFISGVMGRAIGGEHPAHALIMKQGMSCTQGHIHTRDFAERTDATGSRRLGLICGVFQDYDSPWAGEINKLWWRGAVIKEFVENGQYNLRFISLEQLKHMYPTEA